MRIGTSGSRGEGIKARNRPKSTGTARSAILAGERQRIASYRNNRKTVSNGGTLARPRLVSGTRITETAPAPVESRSRARESGHAFYPQYSQVRHGPCPPFLARRVARPPSDAAGLVRADQLRDNPLQFATDLADDTADPPDNSPSLGWCECLPRYRVDTMMREEGVEEFVAPTLK